MTKFLLQWLRVLALLACAGAATAQNYPTQPLRIIVPAGNGSTLDALARIIGGELQRTWGRRVSVENRPGENGNAGTRLAAIAPPDGHTLLMTGAAFAANPYLSANAGYDPLRNFAPVSQLANLPTVVIVHPVFPAQNVKTLVEVLKLSPGQFSYASAGYGTSLHLAGEAFKHANKIDLLHVPFKNSKQAESAIIAGDVQILLAPLPAAMPLIDAGRVRPLAVSTLERHPALIDVPTMEQSGLTDFNFLAWYGIVAPINTPPAVVNKLSQHLNKIMRQPKLRQRLSAQYVEVVGSTPQQFTALIQKDQQRWVAVAEESKRATPKLDEASEPAAMESGAGPAPVETPRAAKQDEAAAKPPMPPKPGAKREPLPKSAAPKDAPEELMPIPEATEEPKEILPGKPQ